MTDVVGAQKVIIRPIRESEVPALEWDGAYTRYRKVFQQTYEDTVRGQRVMLVAVQASQIVGQVFIQLSSTERRYADGYSRGYLYSLRVKSDWQAQGIGTRLVKAAETTLRARGFTTAVIAAGKDNPRARQLYERLGYRAFAEDPGVWYFQDVNGVQQSMSEPCWVMQKRLSSE